MLVFDNCSPYLTGSDMNAVALIYMVGRDCHSGQTIFYWITSDIPASESLCNTSGCDIKDFEDLSAGQVE